MKSANAAGLIRLLLQQSDRHPIRAVGAAELLPYDPRLIRSLRNLGILTEREDLRDDGATVLQVVDDTLIAIDPETGACERHTDALDVQTFDIDITAICRAIREQSGLDGPGPTPISTRPRKARTSACSSIRGSAAARAAGCSSTRRFTTS